jgi:polyhydroxybutyrate depolymerase
MDLRLMFPCIVLFFCVQSGLAQVVSDSILIEGRYRSFHYNRPLQGINDRPLIFVLHGSGGTGRGMMNSSIAMDSVVRASGGVVVYPDGFKRYWNECRKASPAETNKLDINEQAFFQEMINHFTRAHAINRKKVFAVGTSGGGHMVYKLALTMPDQFKAFTAIIANMPDSSNFDCSAAGKGVNMMIVNGTEDTVNPYEGGEVIAGFSLGYVRSTELTFKYWAKLAGYRSEPKIEKVPDRTPGDGRTIERYRYNGKGKPEVILLKVIGGKHDYPKDIDVHVEAWQFFQRAL